MKKMFLIFWFLVISSASYSQGVDPTELFLSYPIENSDITYIDEIHNGILNLTKDDQFTVKVQVEPKNFKHEWFLNQRTLIPQDESIIYKNSAVSKSWVLDVTPAELDIWDYNHIYLEWDQAHPLSEPDIRVSVDIDSDENGTSDIHLKSTYPAPELELTLQHEIDMEKENYAPKSNLYLVRRELGLKEDATWRYVDHPDPEKGNQVVFQRRLDMPLRGLDQLRISFLPGTDFRMVVFSISTVGKTKRDRFLLYQEMTHRREKHGNLEVEVIDLKDTLQRLGIDQSRALLIESILYLGGHTSTFLTEKRVKSLAFYSYTQVKNTGVSEMEPVITKTPTGCSLSFDLEKVFDQREIWSGKILGVTIEAELDSPQKITWKKAWLADRQELDTPTILLEPVNRLADWIPNPSFLKVNQVLTGFTPLFSKKVSIHSPTMPYSTNKQYRSVPHDDADLYIEAQDAFYWLHKNQNSLNLEGIFISNATSSIQIQLKKDRVEQDYHLDTKSCIWGPIEVLNTDKGIIQNPIWSVEPSADVVVSTTQDLLLLFRPAAQSEATQNLNNPIIYWNIQLAKTSNAPYRDFPIILHEPAEPNQQAWKYQNATIQNKSVIGFTGLENISIPLTVGIEYSADTIENHQDEYTVSKEKPNFILDIPPGSQIRDVYLNNPPIDIPIQLECVIVDAQIEEFSESFDLNKLYWFEKEITFPMTSSSDNVIHDSKLNKYFLWKENHETTWKFSLSASYIKPVSLEIQTISDPQIQFAIHHQEKIIPFIPHTTVFDFSPYPEIKSDWSLLISSKGDQELLVIDPPRVTVIGMKKTARECLDDLRIRIDDHYIATDRIQFPTEDTDWQTLGEVSIPASQHALTVEDATFFHMDSLLLEAKSGYPLPDLETNPESGQPSIVSKLARMGIKLGIFFGVLTMFYFIRSQIKYCLRLIFNPIWNLITRIYWFVPEEGLFIFWTLIGGGLYGFGIKISSPALTINYCFTFGGIAMVFTFWHFSHLIRSRFSRIFPKLTFYVYRGPGSPFISGFIVLLVCIAILVLMKHEQIAEQLAVIGYYFLVVGIISEFLEARRNGWEDEAGEEK